MQLLLISPGKKHDPATAELIAEYEKRLSRLYTIEWAFPTAGDKGDEATAIIKRIKDSDHVLLLDQSGTMLDTPALAQRLEHIRQSGAKRLVCIVGGAHGVSTTVLERADTTLSLSPLTFPHMLVRLVIIEQLYRAATISGGGKYHHE